MGESHKRGPDEDASLVKRAQEGDLPAFDELVVKHTPKLYALVYNMTGNREDTNDVLQDIFARAFRNLKNFQGKSAFYTWIYSISVNMTLNFLKKRNREKRVSLDDEELALEQRGELQEMNASSDPVKETERHELNERLSIALQKLSDDHRAVVTMFDILGMPHAEIASILGISSGTVRSRLHYAHRQLQSYLEEFRK
ncbi:MAG: sigma-70 family RNA polymerase sigma factor [Verrucomicrobiota bacterium]